MGTRSKAIVFLVVVAVFAWPGHQTITAVVPLATLMSTAGSPGGSPSAPQPAPSPAPTPTPAPTATPRPTPTPAMKFPGGSPLEVAQIEEWIIRITNEEREKAGLRPFEHDHAISDIARDHSEQMILRGFQHTIGGKDPTDRALAVGYNCRAYRGDGSYSYGLSENITQHPRVLRWSGTSSGWSGYRWRPASYYADAEAAARSMVRGWMRSPGHRANILDRDSRRIGVGVAVKLSTKYGWTVETFYGTQNFSGCR